MNLLDLAFPDQHFDTVLATFVLLCLPAEQQVPALRKLRRVCRPGGAVLLLDYRLSSNAAMRLAMRCLSPWLRWAFAGSYDAGTERHLEHAGLRPAHRRSVLHDSATLMVLKPVPARSAVASPAAASKAGGRRRHGALLPALGRADHDDGDVDLVGQARRAAVDAGEGEAWRRQAAAPAEERHALLPGSPAGGPHSPGTTG